MAITNEYIVLGIVLGFFTFLTGKFFCAYICPGSYLNKLMSSLRKVLKLREIEFEKGSFTDSILRSVKYLILFLVFYFSISTSELFLKAVKPSNIIAYALSSDLNIWITSIVAYSFFVANLFVKKFWCRYMCPMGAAINILNYFYSSVALFILFVVANSAGLEINWKYFLAGSCVIGYLYEIISLAGSNVGQSKKQTGEVHSINEGYTACAKKPYSMGMDIMNIRFDSGLVQGRYSATIAKKRKQQTYIPVIIIFILLSITIYFGSRLEIPASQVYYSKVAANNNN